MDRDERSYLAGEFALGLLEDDERQRVLELMGTDPDLRREVIFWQESLAEMAPGAAEKPSAGVKHRLHAQLFGDRPQTLWQDLLSPEYRGLALAITAVKVVVIAVLLWFVLAG